MNKEKEKTLHDYIADLQLGDPLKLSDEEFTKWVHTLPASIVTEFLETLRSHRDFYKKILEEERRKEKPGSLRYVDAEKKITIANTKGKILKIIYDNLNS